MQDTSCSCFSVYLHFLKIPGTFLQVIGNHLTYRINKSDGILQALDHTNKMDRQKAADHQGIESSPAEIGSGQIFGIPAAENSALSNSSP